MRLTPEEVRAIKAATAHAFGPDAVVRLFGSRVHDHLRGGDIDLHVEASPETNAWLARDRFEESLACRLEPQRIDVIVRRRGEPDHGIDLIARRDGVIL